MSCTARHGCPHETSSNFSFNIASGSDSMGFVEGLVGPQSKAASDDFLVDLGGPPKIETISLNPGRTHDSSP
jgi:hypothetical protein